MRALMLQVLSLLENDSVWPKVPRMFTFRDSKGNIIYVVESLQAHTTGRAS